MHIVFLDNGRLALSRDPVFSQALRCIRCGACANVCPIYGLVGGHNYGHVYIGAIGLILTYFYHGRANARAIVQNCLNCQACKAVCPAGIDLPRLIKEVHGEILSRGRPQAPEKPAPGPGPERPAPLPLPAAPGFPGPKTPGPGGRHDPAPALLFRQGTRFPEPAGHCPHPLSGTGCQKLSRPVAHPRYRVALFGGCLVDFVYPEQGEALLKLLQDHRVQVDYPQGQTCCGLPAKMMGEPEIAQEVARQNLAALDPADYDYILTLCASCGSHLKEAYPQAPGRGAGPGRQGPAVRRQGHRLQLVYDRRAQGQAGASSWAGAGKWPTTPPATCAGVWG